MVFTPGADSGTSTAMTPDRQPFSDESTPYVASVALSGRPQSQQPLGSGIRRADPPPTARNYAAPLARHSHAGARPSERTPQSDYRARQRTPLSSATSKEGTERERAVRADRQTPQSVDRTGRSTSAYLSRSSGGSASKSFDIEAPELKRYIGHGKREGVPVTRVKAGYGSEIRNFMKAAQQAHENLEDADEER